MGKINDVRENGKTTILCTNHCAWQELGYRVQPFPIEIARMTKMCVRSSKHEKEISQQKGKIVHDLRKYLEFLWCQRYQKKFEFQGESRHSDTHQRESNQPIESVNRSKLLPLDTMTRTSPISSGSRTSEGLWVHRCISTTISYFHTRGTTSTPRTSPTEMKYGIECSRNGETTFTGNEILW